MLSDSLLVNYANVWVRPPVEVYSLVPVNELDGIDLFYREQVLGVELEAHLLRKLQTGSVRRQRRQTSRRRGVQPRDTLQRSDGTFRACRGEIRLFRESASSTALARALSGRGLTVPRWRRR